MSLSTIAREDLEVAVADLRNAALVVEHTGHHRGSMVHAKTGAVCASAAIEAATWRSLGYLKGLGLYVLADEQRQTPFRSKNAHKLLSDFLPTDLCEKCTVPDSLGGMDAALWQVVHYNDNHCVGGELLVNMMRLAADRGAIAIEDRRKVLTGLPA